MCVSLVVLIASGARVIIASTEAYSVVTNQQSGVISNHPTTRTVPKYSAALCCSLSVTSWWNHQHCAVLCTPEVFDVCVCVCLELERKPKQQPKTKKKSTYAQTASINQTVAETVRLLPDSLLKHSNAYLSNPRSTDFLQLQIARKREREGES